jgi:hypothetical protein
VSVGNGRDAPTFDDELESLGFQPSGSSRRGGRLWTLSFNRFLTFTLHDYHDAVLLTWAFALGEFVEERGFTIGSGETSFHELFPRRDVRLPLDIDAVGGEITRVLARLRLDLGDPQL